MALTICLTTGVTWTGRRFSASRLRSRPAFPAAVLRTFVDAGPLSALATDARQILRTRADPERLRIVELQVLQSAAELLWRQKAVPANPLGDV